MEYTYEIVRDGSRYAVIQHGRKNRKMYVSPTRDNCEDYIARRQRTAALQGESDA